MIKKIWVLHLVQWTSMMEIRGLEFFPNPVTESLKIRFATPYSGSISISDISGRTVMVRDVTDLSEEVNIDMSYLASGIYIIRLPQHISGRSYKVVKM
ncbi:MAG: T9SS type A sorting domain-containing protein [Saprospiraceae bacterium]|nr:T9SS type A sorting domain-containing protein [Saprospiraceae bacterium]